jgi:two-component system sensor histidine kinase BaeS
MNPARIAIAVFVTILLTVLWRLLKQNSDSARNTPCPASVASAPRPCSQADIRQLLHQMSGSLRDRLHDAGMALELKFSPDPLPVLLDRSGMQEVFAHIVELACRVMKAGSTLHVLGRIDGRQAVVNFMDSAPGADDSRLARCFDAASARLARSRGDTDSIASVALCTQIVGEHRGRIYAAPSPLGRLGITLRLPLQRDRAGRDAPSAR